MPHVILKRVWDYCAYSKKFLAFIFLLLFISSMLQKYILTVGDVYEIYVLQVLVAISVAGYGMVITRDRINHGKRLPKIEIMDIIVLFAPHSIFQLSTWRKCCCCGQRQFI